MCFSDDPDLFHDDDDDDEKASSEELKAFFDYDRAGSFSPNETMLLFGCEVSLTELQLANVLLSRFKTLESACNVLRAANALREVIGSGQTIYSDQTRQWNDQHNIGQQIQFWPTGRNGETYLSRTTSPAFNTPGGPCVLVADHDKAVAISNVHPTKVNSPEVSQ